MRPGSDARRSGREYSRRQFGQAAAGIVLFFAMRPGVIVGQPAPARLPADLDANSRLDSWLRINPEGNIEVFTGKVELGQGNLTALAQIAAEELDVAFERVRMRPVDTTHSPDEGYTAGSASIEATGSALRYAAANTRVILLEMAAAKLGMSIDTLTVDDGVISSSAAANRVTACAQRQQRRPSEESFQIPDRGYVCPAARHPREAYRWRSLRAGYARARDAVRPRRAAARL
jgi:CO/xanthine dehydrogenase Mo-binding subunit